MLLAKDDVRPCLLIASAVYVVEMGSKLFPALEVVRDQRSPTAVAAHAGTRDALLGLGLLPRKI